MSQHWSQVSVNHSATYALQLWKMASVIYQQTRWFSICLIHSLFNAWIFTVWTQFMNSTNESTPNSSWSSGWWFGTWILWLSIYWECHHTNWRFVTFFRGVGKVYHQPGKSREEYDHCDEVAGDITNNIGFRCLENRIYPSRNGYVTREHGD